MARIFKRGFVFLNARKSWVFIELKHETRTYWISYTLWAKTVSMALKIQRKIGSNFDHSKALVWYDKWHIHRFLKHTWLRKKAVWSAEKC